MIEKDASYVVETESSARGRVIKDLIFWINNDLTIGKKIKSGELRKKFVNAEPEWKVPDGYNMTQFNRKNFSMKLLSKKSNPNCKLQIQNFNLLTKCCNEIFSGHLLIPVDNIC